MTKFKCPDCGMKYASQTMFDIHRGQCKGPPVMPPFEKKVQLETNLPGDPPRRVMFTLSQRKRPEALDNPWSPWRKKIKDISTFKRSFTLDGGALALTGEDEGYIQRYNERRLLEWCGHRKMIERDPEVTALDGGRWLVCFSRYVKDGEIPLLNFIEFTITPGTPESACRIGRSCRRVLESLPVNGRGVKKKQLVFAFTERPDQYRLQSYTGGFYYGGKRITMDIVTQKSHRGNTGYTTDENRQENVTEFRCDSLAEPILKGTMPSFRFNRGKERWETTLTKKYSGAVYNTMVYVNEAIRLAFDLQRLRGTFHLDEHVDDST